MITIAKCLSDQIPNPKYEKLKAKSESLVAWSTVALILEIVVLLLKMTTAALEALLKIFIPPHEKPLLGEVVLITGSGHGIGRELVIQFALNGCTVICWDKDEIGNKGTLKTLSTMGCTSSVHAYTCDVSNREEVLTMAKKVKQEVGQVTILINNAGIMPCRPIHLQKPEQIQKVFDINVVAHFWTLEAFLPDMKKKNCGHIVAISSMCGVIGLPNAVPYSASKFAVRGLMEALSEEMRLSKTNIQFTTVFPFTVETGLVKKPKIRFPSIMSMLTPEEVALQVLKAVRQGTKELSLPRSMLPMDKISRLLPNKVIELTKDFLDSGVEPELE